MMAANQPTHLHPKTELSVMNPATKACEGANTDSQNVQSQQKTTSMLKEKVGQGQLGHCLSARFGCAYKQLVPDIVLGGLHTGEPYRSDN